ncbi:glycosyl hydrolase 115 family protein [Bacteroides sp. 51]|uniref:glycosyl hydrolase 115 family protein n=1 Tax=Bacteroides sp. 51 TaxID=2302938 RepID=UPI0013D53AF9|nr:glycosyl hydrolase 115 family protein [Bacteroides sp. 51]NDV81583.1 glycosyhydrolase [Bacteroides sp. 51]
MKRFIPPLFALLLMLPAAVQAQADARDMDSLVTNNPSSGTFPLVASGKTAALCYDAADYPGVIRAIGDLRKDIERVTDCAPALHAVEMLPRQAVIIGTLGKSRRIDELVKSGKLPAKDLRGKWESFVITTIDNPFPGTERAVVIAGSDKRGTIYGIYELSRQLGVSPWYWWADVPPLKRKEAYITSGYHASGEPKVRYRGIFINDEIPCMTDWAREKFGGMNSGMYAHVFELLLRLRANYLWPGMWGSFKEYNPGVPILFDDEGRYEGNSFNEDDPANPRLADEYGIVMGTSHHEPMQRSQQEWLRNKQNYGNAEWNYVTNRAGIRKFFTEGMENTRNYESIITLGMRGDDDKPMADAGSIEENFRVLENIIADQRNIIRRVTGKPADQTPQVWTLYKEVLDYYDLGLNVPDDVIVLLCDDDWGDVRYLPALNGKRHSGGYGMYYHAGYYGAPRASKWLNMSQISHIWEQLQLTYSYGVDKIWILNVGDIKPCEYPMDFFLKMAWNPERFNSTNLQQYARDFCAEQFGQSQAAEAAEILDTYCKYAGRVVAEMMDEKSYDLESGEFKTVRDAFMALEARALRQYLALPGVRKDAYHQLVRFPVQAMANLYDLYYSLAMNRKLGVEKDPAANYWADRVEACFRHDATLCTEYNHDIADGKWNHMMDQVHIGYTFWHPPVQNIMPQVIRVRPEEVRAGGYTFNHKNRVVVMEAEHYYTADPGSGKAAWTVIPDLGRTLSGVALMPYDQETTGAALTYKMKLAPGNARTVALRVITDCTLPFLKGGHSIAAAFAGAEEKTVGINQELTWKNNYSKMYPAAAERIIETVLELPLPQGNGAGEYSLILRPLNPGIVFQKIIVDLGGYEDTRLKMPESPYIKE